MLRNLFHMTNRVFRSNVPEDANHKYPINLNKLRKGDDDLLTRKTNLGCDIDMEAKIIHLPEAWAAILRNALSDIP